MMNQKEHKETLATDHERRLGRISVHVVQSNEGFSALSVRWNELVQTSRSATIFQTFEWMSAWWKHFGAHPSRTLYILLFKANGDTVGIAPLFREEIMFLQRQIFVRLRMMGCGVEDESHPGLLSDLGPSDYLDFIVDPEFETDVGHAFALYLAQHPELFDEIELPHLPDYSSVVRSVVRYLNEFKFSTKVLNADVCPYLLLPSSVDEFFQELDANVRHRLHQAQRAYKETVIYSMETVTSPKGLESAFRDLIMLHQLRWMNIGYPGLFSDERFKNFQEEVAKAFYEKGWLWFKLARMGGIRIAARYGFVFKGRMYDYLSGFDDRPPWTKKRPGLALLLAMIEDAVHMRLYSVDLLRGDEKYKFELTSEFGRNKRLVAMNRSSSRLFRVRIYRFIKPFRWMWKRVRREVLLLQVHLRTAGVVLGFPSYLAFRVNLLIRKTGVQKGFSFLAQRARRHLRNWAKLAEAKLIDFKKALNDLPDIPARMLARLFLRNCDILGRRARVYARPIIHNEGRITIGDDCVIDSRAARCEISAVDEGSIEIGNNVTLDSGASIASRQSVQIGNNVRIGPHVMIVDWDMEESGGHPLPSSMPIVIEESVSIEANVTVLKGSVLGKGSIIRAGTVVIGVIPPHSVVSGTPAKVIEQQKGGDPKKSESSEAVKHEA